MSNRTAVIAFAAIAGCVSTFSFIPVSHGEPAAADECLTAPKAATPAGAHWYYRVEKGTKRKCWYLADEAGKTKKAAAPAPASSDVAEENAPAPEKVTPPAKQETSSKPIRKSVANARAELRAGSEDDPALAETTWPAISSTPADADVRKDNQAAAIQPAPEVDKQDPNIATRWPEPTVVASASDQPAATTPQPAPSAPALTPERLAAAATAAQSPASAPAITTGAAPSQPQPSPPAAATEEGLSIRVLLAILVGVLALAAILGPLLFKYFRPKPREDDRTYAQRRPIWDLNESERSFRQDYPPLADETHHVDEPHYGRTLPEARVLDTEVDELEQLLARAAKRSAS